MIEQICIVILFLAVIGLSIWVGTQRERFQKPIIGDFQDLYDFLGIHFSTVEKILEFTDGKGSPFGGLKSLFGRLEAVIAELGLSIDSDGNVGTTKEGGLVDRVKDIRSIVLDSIVPYVGITWERGEYVDAGYGLSKTLADLKKQFDSANLLLASVQNLLATKVSDSDLSTVQDSVATVRERLDEIRKKAGFLEPFEVLMEQFTVTEDQAKTLIEKGYDSVKSIVDKSELDFIKSCGLDVSIASLVYAKAKELTEEKAKALTDEFKVKSQE